MRGRYPGHPESVDALVAFDEDTLLTGSSDGVIRIVSVLPNKLLGVLGQHPDGFPVERLALSGVRLHGTVYAHSSSIALVLNDSHMVTGCAAIYRHDGPAA